jgi:ATP-dependent Clp protease ATP-binding subunit ClpC
MRAKWEEHQKELAIGDSRAVIRQSSFGTRQLVSLSVRFDPDHQLPDKAIDLVDKAGARTRVPVLSMMPGGKDGRREREDGRGIAAGAEETSGEVTELTVAQVLSDKIGVPLEVVTGHLEGPALSDRRFFAALRMTGGSEGMAQSRLLELNSFLKKRLIGQDEAVERVCRRLLMAHAGLAQRRGPLGVFLFLRNQGHPIV